MSTGSIVASKLKGPKRISAPRLSDLLARTYNIASRAPTYSTYIRTYVLSVKSAHYRTIVDQQAHYHDATVWYFRTRVSAQCSYSSSSNHHLSFRAPLLRLLYGARHTQAVIHSNTNIITSGFPASRPAPSNNGEHASVFQMSNTYVHYLAHSPLTQEGCEKSLDVSLKSLRCQHPSRTEAATPSLPEPALFSLETLAPCSPWIFLYRSRKPTPDLCGTY